MLHRSIPDHRTQPAARIVGTGDRAVALRMPGGQVARSDEVAGDATALNEGSSNQSHRRDRDNWLHYPCITATLVPLCNALCWILEQLCDAGPTPIGPVGGTASPMHLIPWLRVSSQWPWLCYR